MLIYKTMQTKGFAKFNFRKELAVDYAKKL